MPFLSFGSKKDKIKKLIVEERFDEILKSATKDKKTFQALIELLDEKTPGIIGDSLLILTNVLETNPELFREYASGEFFKKLISLTEHRNPYVRENAMVLSYRIIQAFPQLVSKHRDWIVETMKKTLHEGTKEQKGFLLVIAGELKLSELREEIEELTTIEDKVILPFEGKKWVPLGEIARETLEKLP